MKQCFYLIILAFLFSCTKDAVDAMEESIIECRITVGEYYSKGVDSYKEIYEYDINGKLTKYSEVPEDKTFKIYEVFYENEYDSHGNLVKVSRHIGDHSYFRIENFAYHNNGKLKSFKIDLSSTNFSHFEYNTEGLETSSIINNNNNIKEKLTSFNSQNQISQEVLKQNGVLISTKNYTYRLDQKLEKIETIYKDNTEISNYIYNEENKLVKVINNEGKVSDYTYSPLTMQVITSENGKIVQAIKETYDSNGNMLKSFTALDGSNFVLMKEFAFFPNNSKSQERSYTLKKNSKTESRLYYETNHNETGKMLNYTDFDEFGNINFEIKNTFICE